MKHSLNQAIVALLGAVIVVASGWAPVAEARGGGGGGGFHGGGGGGGR